MPNLIPEKRVDKNGVLTTKHVRATPKVTSNRTAIPSPVASGTSLPAKKAYKPRPRQTEQTHRGYRLAHFASNLPLTTAGDRAVNKHMEAYCDFKASDVEIYDVLSATGTQGDALELMVCGVRTAADARSYLKRHRAGHLIADRSALMQAALERGISGEDFLYAYEGLTPGQRESPHVLDAVQFRSSALQYNDIGLVFGEIMAGNVSFADLKTIGITRLKTHSRAWSLKGVLTKLNRGQADYSVEDVKTFVIRAAEAKTNDEQFRAAAEFAYRRGFDLIQENNDFHLLHREYQHYRDNTSIFRREHPDEDDALTFDRIEYGFRLRKLLGDKFVYSGFSTPYFESDIPIDTAAQVILSGGGVREAQAIHEGGIESSLSGGWL